MRGYVNYYHYSVYKLLVVNLRTLASHGRADLNAARKKKNRLRSSTLSDSQATSNPFLPATNGTTPAAQKKSGSGRVGRLSGTAASMAPAVRAGRGPIRGMNDHHGLFFACKTRSNTAAPTPSVDKPMNIHRIECAKPAPARIRVFLSKFGSIPIQGLCKRLRRT